MDKQNSLQEKFEGEWALALINFIKKTSELASQEQRRKAKPRVYAAFLESAIRFGDLERRYLAQGCEAPVIPRGIEELQGLEKFPAMARELAGAVPDDTPAEKRGLFSRVISGLVAAARSKEHRK